MCLDKVTESVETPINKEVWVMKTFAYKPDDLVINSKTSLYGIVHNRMKKYPIGKWIKASKVWIDINNNIWTGNPYLYRSGFHGYAKKRSKYNYQGQYNRQITIPVKFRKVRTIGMQNGQKVFVADEMYIPKNWWKG